MQQRFSRRLVFCDSEVGRFRHAGDSPVISSSCKGIDASSLRVYKKMSVEAR